MKKLIIFGTGNIAELAYYYITEDTDYDISAFTVEKDHIKNNLFMEKPVVAFENIEDLYDPKDYYMFAPISAKCLNKFREKIYKLGKEKGYRFINYISSRATILTKDIGENCFILEDNTIQHRVKIGNNCIISWIICYYKSIITKADTAICGDQNNPEIFGKDLKITLMSDSSIIMINGVKLSLQKEN